jgi:hypothetical protein
MSGKFKPYRVHSRRTSLFKSHLKQRSGVWEVCRAGGGALMDTDLTLPEADVYSLSTKIELLDYFSETISRNRGKRTGSPLN